jgi:hypothetical protein
VPESVAVIVTLKVPAEVAVPEIVPDVLKLNPDGRDEPLAAAQLQVMGGVPPEDPNVWL